MTNNLSTKIRLEAGDLHQVELLPVSFSGSAYAINGGHHLVASPFYQRGGMRWMKGWSSR